jgi:3'-phosphoadenosine 5'-phosphosulfate sulfotransferase
MWRKGGGWTVDVAALSGSRILAHNEVKRKHNLPSPRIRLVLAEREDVESVRVRFLIQSKYR